MGQVGFSAGVLLFPAISLPAPLAGKNISLPAPLAGKNISLPAALGKKL